MSETIDLASLTADDFTPHVDSQFDLNLPNGSKLPLTLVTVQDLIAENPQYKRAFSLLFDGPREPILPQSIYALRHETLGGLDIFLVPIGVTPEHCLYQAVFN